MNTAKKLKGLVLEVSKIALTVVLLSSVFSCDNKEKNESNMESKKPKSVILINPFEVPDAKLRESIIYWEACRDFLKMQPGYISTKLHQSIKDDARFMLINVAEWESAKAFMEASQKMAEELEVKPPEGLKANPSLNTVISN